MSQISERIRTKRKSEPDDDRDRQQQELIQIMRHMHFSNPSLPNFTTEMNEVFSLRCRLDSLFQSRRRFLQIRSKDIFHCSRYFSDHDILRAGDRLQFNDFLLDRLGLIVMCTLVSDLAPRVPKVSYSLFCSGLNEHVDLLRPFYNLMLERLLDVWVRKSNILNAEFGKGVEVIRSGLLLKVKVDFKANVGVTTVSDIERGHEIYMCIEKRRVSHSSTAYNFYLYDINADETYLEIPSQKTTTNGFIKNYLKTHFLTQKGIDLNVFSCYIRDLLPIHIIPDAKLSISHDPMIIKLGRSDHTYSPYNLFDNISYMCTTAARRAAIYTACSVYIQDTELFDERLNSNYLFYQNYINYLTQTYRMAIWILEKPELWTLTTNQTVLQRLEEMEKPDGRGYIADRSVYWSVLLMATEFWINEMDIRQSYTNSRIDEIMICLDSSKAYISIIEFTPGGRLLPKKHYWYQHGPPAQDAFIDKQLHEDHLPTCTQMSHFGFSYPYFR